MDAMAERLRTPEALRAYRQAGPLIYTEMSRRMAAADTSALLAEMAETGSGRASWWRSTRWCRRMRC